MLEKNISNNNEKNINNNNEKNISNNNLYFNFRYYTNDSLISQ